MDWMRRLLGGAAPAEPVVTSVRTVSFVRTVRDDAALHVVGEQYRASKVRQAQPPGPDDLPPGLPAPPPGFFKAILIPEPTNPHDPNAIMVALWAGGTWVHVGYLARGDAADFQPFFRHLLERASGAEIAVACDAARGRHNDGLDVVLHLGTPGECAADDIVEDRSPLADHPWRGKRVAFAGQMVTTINGVLVDRHAQRFLARWAGCEVVPRLTKETGLLVVADLDEPTDDLQRAREHGIPAVDERAFYAGIGLPAEALGVATERWARG